MPSVTGLAISPASSRAWSRKSSTRSTSLPPADNDDPDTSDSSGSAVIGTAIVNPSLRRVFWCDLARLWIRVDRMLGSRDSVHRRSQAHQRPPEPMDPIGLGKMRFHHDAAKDKAASSRSSGLDDPTASAPMRVRGTARLRATATVFSITQHDGERNALRHAERRVNEAVPGSVLTSVWPTTDAPAWPHDCK
jgi:hypothetical protein